MLRRGGSTSVAAVIHCGHCSRMILHYLARCSQALEQCGTDGFDGLAYCGFRLRSGRPIRDPARLVLSVSHGDRLPNLLVALGEQPSLNRNVAIRSLSHKEESLLPLDIDDR